MQTNLICITLFFFILSYLNRCWKTPRYSFRGWWGYFFCTTVQFHFHDITQSQTPAGKLTLAPN